MIGAMNLKHDFKALADDLRHFPWGPTFATLRERFSQDRLGLTASSLTFTTLIALVPFFALILAMFTAFPMFGKFQTALQQWLLESLVPDNIARQVLGYLTQFAAKASRLGWFGLMLLATTAFSLVLTIDRTLNQIWRVRRQRPWSQRVVIYWSALSLGPVLMGASLSATSYAISASKGFVTALPGGVGLLIDALQWLLMALGMAALYRYVPNTTVRWRHALIGGIFVSTAFEAAKTLLGLYLASVPTYSVVYGTFATLPILLIWIYVAWLIVLFGAVIAAYLPSLLAGVQRRANVRGWAFQLALELVGALNRAKGQTVPGKTQEELARELRLGQLQLETPLQALQQLGWVGRLEADEIHQQRYVLLVDTDSTPLRPLIESLLMEPDGQSTAVLNQLFRDGVTLGSVTTGLEQTAHGQTP
jgi:membrane protein